MLLSRKFVHYLIISLILCLTLFTRVYHLNTTPPGLFYDEVDAGYQAFTFLHRQTDYFGNRFPIHFHSFSDWRTSLHIYTIAFFQFLTLPPELSIRLPSAIFGVISGLLIYLITRSLTASFLWAISPWSIHFSRTGFEVSGMLALILAGIYFWQKFITTSTSSYLFLALFFFLLSPYFYSTAKLFILIIIPLFICLWPKVFLGLGVPRISLLIIFGSLILTPMFIDTLAGHSGFRFSYISIFSEPHKSEIVDRLRYEDIYTAHYQDTGVAPPLTSIVFHNKFQLVIDKFIRNYISSFSTNFLILQGDSNLRQGFGNLGLIYFIDLFFLLAGIYYSFTHRLPLHWLFLSIFLLSPIPFALTRDSDSPHATRLILMLPSIIYFSSLSLDFIRRHQPRVFYLLISLYLFSFVHFWHYYHSHYPQISAKSWQTGMQEIISQTQKFPSQPIFFSSKDNPFLPFYVFYTRYLPPPHQSLAGHLDRPQLLGFTGDVLDHRLYFGFLDWPNIRQLPPGSLVVMTRSEYINLNQSKFKVIYTNPRRYLEQDEFYLLGYL